MNKLLTTCTVFFVFLANAQSVPFDQKLYKAFIDMRVGNGNTPTYWYCYGEVYTYPQGKLISKMEGVDMARYIPITADSTVQISRKIFIYTDTATGEALETYNGNTVTHIQYPYQQISYVLKQNKLVSWVTQGSGSSIQTIGPGTKTFARKLGKNVMFSAPLFLNIKTPRGVYEAYENYDFIVSPKAKTTQQKYQLMWNRYGDLPPFAGQGKCIIQLVCYRVNAFDQLSEPLKKYITTKAPLWLDAPKNMAEIKALQAAQ